MSNVHPSSSKQRLPFDLKVKPARHYVSGGSIYFMVEKGKLYGRITVTGKNNKTTFPRFEVKSKEHLDKILKSKTCEQPILEVIR